MYREHWTSFARRAWIPRDLPAAFPLAVWCPAENLINSAGVITSAWKDASGNGRDGTPANSPTYNAGAIGGLPAAGFVKASSQKFSFANVFGSLTAAELYIVCKSTATTVGLHNFGNSAGTQELFPFSDNHVYENFASSSRNDIGTPTLSSFIVYNVRSAAGAWSAHINGVQQFTTGTNTVAWTTNPAIGGSAGSGSPPSTFLTGQVSEFLIVGAILDSTTRVNLHSYLHTKFPGTI